MATFSQKPPPAQPMFLGTDSVRQIKIERDGDWRWYRVKMSATEDFKKSIYENPVIAINENGTIAGDIISITDDTIKYLKYRKVDANGEYESDYGPVLKIDLPGPPPVVTPPTPPATGLLPWDIIPEMSKFKLTTPDGPAEHPTEFEWPALKEYKSKWFKVGTLDGIPCVLCTAPVTGVTTSSSGYPRTEFREMDGKAKMAFNSTKGTHTMSVTQAITVLPGKKPHVVSAQIHDAEDDVVMIRLEGKKLFVESPYGEDQLLDPNYVLGQHFTVTITANKSGIEIEFYNHDTRLKAEGLIKKTGTGWYFKWGCYTQANTSNGTGEGQTATFNVSVSHKAA